MIELRHVWVERQGRQILSDVTFDVNRGEFVYLLGPDGAGKSTILSLILFEQRPTRGRVFVGDCDSATIGARRIPFLRRRVGMVLQNHKLLRDRTVFQNVAISLEVTGLRSSVVKKRTLALLSDVDLIHKRRAYPDALSGGEQQRVAIARALVNEPVVVLADEPTAHQDPEGTEQVMKILADANGSGTAVLMATHDVDLVNRSPRRTLYLREGRLQSPGEVVRSESISEST
jgi:cell division transport system ATP-binding protein